MNITGWEAMYRAGERGSEDHPTILLEEAVAAAMTNEELAQDGRGVKRASPRTSEFLSDLVARSRALCAGRALDLACGSGRNALYLARQGWEVTAIDGSEKAIELLESRARDCKLSVEARVGDLTAADFQIAEDSYDLVVIAFYLQRDLFPKVKAAVRQGGLVVAIAHIPDPGEAWTEKRAAAGELETYFEGWEVLWKYEGASRDPAHRRPVAEVLARKR